ncbi:MAG: energy coupling factor transporter S component ThiW [Catonella sp.]|uniref:energy coupling factor transporter S component ThiW n=1 Tax=Catonella sp. TaxID=2382125 RepID=UPI003FA079CF
MNYWKVKKLVIASMFVAVGVIMSPLNIPLGASKCFPTQHIINVILAVFLGPAYGVGAAFATSLIRNMIGTGTLLAFPGSMVGALFCGMAYKITKKLWITCIFEVIGTGILGALLAFPVAILIMGKEAAMFTFVIPFLVSTAGGSLIASILIFSMEKMGINSMLKHQMEV